MEKSYEGVEEDCVVGEVRLLCCQPIDDRLVQSRHQDVDASQGEDKDDAGENSDFMEEKYFVCDRKSGNIFPTYVILKKNLIKFNE